MGGPLDLTKPDARGFSLIEVMAAAVISVIAILGLAYSFSAGRGLIDRYATARDALECAERRLDTLAMLALENPATPELAIGIRPIPPIPHTLNKNQTGTETWTVVWVDDPVDNASGDPNPNDYKRVTVEVRWNQAGIQDRITLSRVFLAP